MLLGVGSESRGDLASKQAEGDVSTSGDRDELLTFTYQEVLDATKHQDDKINRLLTTIAFLTAAALALASFGSSEPLLARFDVGPDLRLALILLGIFLTGVVASVVMLIGSLTTPLRFPGGHKKPWPEIRYATQTAGIVYFHEIAATSPAEWYLKWAQPAQRLKDERYDSLVRETHNLAVRTEAKYARTNEAVAVMTFSLLAFALAAILVLVAAPTAPSVVTLRQGERVPLALVMYGYCVLQLLAQARSLHTVPELYVAHGTAGRQWSFRWVARLTYPVVASAVPAALIWIRTDRWAALTFVVLPVTSLVLYASALPWTAAAIDALREREDWILGQLDPPVQLEAMPRAKLPWEQLRWPLCLAAGFGIIGVWSVISGWYLLQLIGAFAAGVAMLVSSITRPSSSDAKRLREYVKRTSAAHG